MLQESETDSIPTLDIMFGFQTFANLAAVEALIDDLERSIEHCHSVECPNGNWISVTLDNLTRDMVSNKAKLEALVDDTAMVVKDRVSRLKGPNDRGDSTIGTVKGYLIFYHFPTFPVEWNDITLDCKKIPNLKDIHKFITCEDFVIEHPEYVKGGVVDLLKVKAKEISIEYHSVTQPDWVFYINDYLEDYKPGRDVMEYQEDLIQAGLKEFAR